MGIENKLIRPKSIGKIRGDLSGKEKTNKNFNMVHYTGSCCYFVNYLLLIGRLIIEGKKNRNIFFIIQYCFINLYLYDDICVKIYSISFWFNF